MTEPTPDPQEHLGTFAGLATHYVEQGSGTPVVLLHGFSGSVETMDGLAAPLAAAGYRVIRMDLMGHGLSAKPAEPGAYTLEAAAAQVVDLIRGHIGAPAAVVGYSMGGRVALAAALGAPELISRLVLIGATAGLSDPALRSARDASDRELADEIEERGTEWFADEWMAKPFLATQRRLGPGHLAAARTQRINNDAAALANSLRGMGTGAQASYWHLLGSMEPSLLFVAGEDDKKFVEIGEQMVAAVHDGMLVTVPGVGHAAHVEAPHDVAAVIDHFLRSHRGGPFD
jgi:2-succinyl-6-hydroxy-2,4-cyclohexadiene-1-carboxylate synthase